MTLCISIVIAIEVTNEMTSLVSIVIAIEAMLLFDGSQCDHVKCSVHMHPCW